MDEHVENIKKLSEKIGELMVRAHTQGRALSADEAALVKEFRDLIEDELRQLPQNAPLTRPGSNLGGRSFGDPGVLIFQDAEGRSIEAFSNSKRFSALKGEEKIEGIGPGSLGKILRARILGDPMGLNPSEIRALGESVGGAGGWFVSPQLSSYVIDLARNKSCVLLAGGWTLPMSTEEMTLVKVLTDPTAYWVAEHAKITESEGTFGPIKLKAMVVGCLVRVSRALLEDAPNSGNVIESQIGAALGLEVDRCALLGNGVNEPKGLDHCADINSYSMGANGKSVV